MKKNKKQTQKQKQRKLTIKEVLIELKLSFNSSLAKLTQQSTASVGLLKCKEIITQNNSQECLRVYLESLQTLGPKSQLQLEYEFRVMEMVVSQYGREFYDPIDVPNNQLESTKRLLMGLFNQFQYVTQVPPKQALFKVFQNVYQKIMEEWKHELRVKILFMPLIKMVGAGNSIQCQQTAMFILLQIVKWTETAHFDTMQMIQKNILDLFMKKCDECYFDLLECICIFFKYQNSHLDKIATDIVDILINDLRQKSNSIKKIPIVDALTQIIKIMIKDKQPFLKDHIHNSKDVIQALELEMIESQDKKYKQLLQTALNNWKVVFVADSLKDEVKEKIKRKNQDLQNLHELRKIMKMQNKPNFEDSFKNMKFSNFIKKGQGKGGGKQLVQNTNQEILQIKDMIKTTIQNLKDENKQVKFQKEQMKKDKTIKQLQLEDQQLQIEITENYQQKQMNMKLQQQIQQLKEENQNLVQNQKQKIYMKESQVQSEEIDLVKAYNSKYTNFQKEFEELNINHRQESDPLLTLNQPQDQVKESQCNNLNWQPIYEYKKNNKLQPIRQNFIDQIQMDQSYDNNNDKSNEKGFNIKEHKNNLLQQKRKQHKINELNKYNLQVRQIQPQSNRAEGLEDIRQEYLQSVQNQIDSLYKKNKQNNLKNDQKIKRPWKQNIEIQCDLENDTKQLLEKKEISIQVSLNDSLEDEQKQEKIEDPQDKSQEVQQNQVKKQENNQDQQQNKNQQSIEYNSQVIEQIISQKLENIFTQFQNKYDQQKVQMTIKSPQFSIRDVPNQINQADQQLVLDYEQHCQYIKSPKSQNSSNNQQRQNIITSQYNFPSQATKEFLQKTDSIPQTKQEVKMNIENNQEKEQNDISVEDQQDLKQQLEQQQDDIYIFTEEDYQLMEQMSSTSTQDLRNIDHKKVKDLQNNNALEQTYFSFLESFIEQNLFEKMTDEEQYGIQKSLKMIENTDEFRARKNKILQKIMDF